MAWTKEIPANPVVAVAGATGAVGREFLEVLHDLDFPASEVRALASSRSAGKKLPFKGCGQVPAGDLIVEEMTRQASKVLTSRSSRRVRAFRKKCARRSLLQVRS